MQYLYRAHLAAEKRRARGGVCRIIDAEDAYVCPIGAMGAPTVGIESSRMAGSLSRLCRS